VIHVEADVLDFSHIEGAIDENVLLHSLMSLAHGYGL
jgi:hypothetical protein